MQIGQKNRDESEPTVGVATSPPLADDLQERLTGTYEATLRLGGHVVPPSVNPRLKLCVDRVSGLAALYFKQHIRVWPPHLLVKKTVRKVLLPVLAPQVEYNEAMRDCAIEMRTILEQEAGHTLDTAQKIRDLEEKVEWLEAQVQNVMRHSAASAAAAAVTVD